MISQERNKNAAIETLKSPEHCNFESVKDLINLEDSHKSPSSFQNVSIQETDKSLDRIY